MRCKQLRDAQLKCEFFSLFRIWKILIVVKSWSVANEFEINLNSNEFWKKQNLKCGMSKRIKTNLWNRFEVYEIDLKKKKIESVQMIRNKMWKCSSDI